MPTEHKTNFIIQLACANISMQDTHPPFPCSLMQDFLFFFFQEFMTPIVSMPNCIHKLISSRFQMQYMDLLKLGKFDVVYVPEIKLFFTSYLDQQS